MTSVRSAEKSGESCPKQKILGLPKLLVSEGGRREGRVDMCVVQETRGVTSSKTSGVSPEQDQGVRY